MCQTPTFCSVSNWSLDNLQHDAPVFTFRYYAQDKCVATGFHREWVGGLGVCVCGVGGALESRVERSQVVLPRGSLLGCQSLRKVVFKWEILSAGALTKTVSQQTANLWVLLIRTSLNYNFLCISRTSDRYILMQVKTFSLLWDTIWTFEIKLFGEDLSCFFFVVVPPPPPPPPFTLHLSSLGGGLRHPHWGGS